ncbi:MAG: FecR domain-containing protein [Chitinophaga sp.]|uniref:FecR family protein n=1 Tax=Chitinophaga sp. TaxID=1869181 RepID=UPI001B12B276|nr:FecR family protein [Chitinophaga sp.]MBO9732107.1 FecR domain-containing protein [Chitinophaga sp.]
MNTPFVELIDAYLTDSLTPEQEAAFLYMLEDKTNSDILDRVMAEKAADQSFVGEEDIDRREKNLLVLQERLQHLREDAAVVNIRPLYRYRWAAAAAMLLLLVGGIYMLLPRGQKKTNPIAQAARHPEDIAPGRNGAILTLSDGSAVVLDTMHNGEVANQNGTKVLLKNDALTYAPDGQRVGTPAANVLSTPRGRQFNVVLPDGTKAWLNAASSITYPTAFNGRERRVAITGEVYLEVAANAQQPFYVSINKQTTIQVLGTSFNINAYTDEPVIKTTLLQGSVKVVIGAKANLLQPGEEAITASGSDIKIQPADIGKVMAWKKGMFDVEGEGTAAFLRQLARWYDLEIVYQGAIPEKKFHGKLGRDLQLSQVLDVLSQFNIKYKLEGKTLTIL